MARKRKAKPPRLKDVDLSRKLRDEEAYDDRLKKLQLELLALQQAYMRQRRRAIVVLEGWDTAGKGGLIRRMSTRLDPRYFLVWPIAAPSAEEQGRHYLYRFWRRIPAPSTIAVFDRSWYGRVLVERVEGLASRREWQRAYDEINAFEAMLTDDGVRLVKLFLHISPQEQLHRFRERLSVPYKRWKLTAEDLRNRANWQAYAEAVDDMFAQTHTRHAPWHGVPMEFKWYGRIAALKIILEALGKGVDTRPPPADPQIAKAIAAM
jgi:polyphosphate kinase 2 (PPK2 family)